MYYIKIINDLHRVKPITSKTESSTNQHVSVKAFTSKVEKDRRIYNTMCAILEISVSTVSVKTITHATQVRREQHVRCVGVKTTTT